MKLYTKILCFGVLFFYQPAKTQTITVSGVGITNSIVLTQAGTTSFTYNGTAYNMPYYTGTGTVNGTAGVNVAMWWESANNAYLWVLAFDGQPYYSNTFNNTPPGSAFKPWSAVSGTSSPGPSPLSVTGAVALPVTISGFTASLIGNSIALNWTTQSETNNKGFQVQRSTDNITWSDVAFVDGKGTSNVSNNYIFLDGKSNLSGTIYYRLQQTDYDGTTTLSSIVSVKIPGTKDYQLFSNPSNGVFRVVLSQEAVNASFAIYDLSGKLILSKKAITGENSLDISNSVSGMYLLKIMIGNENYTEKLIKK